MKKFWKYLAIVLLSLIGLCAIGVLYLFFVPNSSLFGICYISYNKEYFSQRYNTEEFAVNKIVLNSRDYELVVQNSSNNNTDIYAKVYSNSFGFTLKKHSQVNIESKLVEGCLTIDITEPYGACIPGRSKITMVVPANFSADLALSNHNSSTTIEAGSLNISNLACTTNNGEFFVNACKINGKISVSLNRGNFTLNKAVQLNTNNLELKTNTGNLYASEVELGNVKITKNNRAMIKIKSCVSFDLNNTTAGGSVEIGTVGEFSVNSSDTNLSVNQITTGGAVVLSKSGKVKIGEINAQTSIKTKDGNITVDKATSPLFLVTTGSGNVVLKSTTSSLFAETTYGDITAYFAEESASFADNTNARRLQAKTSSGDILASGVENVNIEVTGKGTVKLYMKHVLKDNEISINSGSAYVEFADDSSFVLNTKSVNGKANVNYLSSPDLSEPNKEYTGNCVFNINASTDSENKLTISSNSGFIKVRDNSTKNY